MRVAVRHTDENHPNSHWFAVQEGRILGFTNPLTGESYSADTVAQALLSRAKSQFPEAAGYEHRIETLHVASFDEDGYEVGEWHPAGESDLPRAGQGQQVADHTLTTVQGQVPGQEDSAQ